MVREGLKPNEARLMAAAGAGPALVEAVSAEAATMRWLFMMRFPGFLLTGLIGVAVSIWISATFELEGWRDMLSTAIAPAVVGLLVVVSRLEAESLRSQAPVRWAARKLAIAVVQAAQITDKPGGAVTRELERLIAVGEGHDTARGALRAIAREMSTPGPRGGGAATHAGSARFLLSDRAADRIATAAFAIALCALIVMAVLRFS